jgi:hypothetical protein
MNKCHKLLLTTAFAITSIPAQAESLSWSFISADYDITTVELDGVADDLEGSTISFEGSFSPVENFALIAGYATGSADVSGNGNTIDMDLDGYYLGGLFYTSVTESTDFFAGARYFDLSVDLSLNGTSAGSEDGNGNGLFLGVRGMVNPQLELRGMIERTDIESETNTDISFEAGYYIAPDFSVNAGYEFDSDSNSLAFGIVKHF